jgi:DNA-directed RNA polymerase specialized sigma24 family protein
MSGQERTSESRGGPGAGLSPAEATRLWDVFRSGSEPDATEALDRLYRCLRRPLVEFCRLKGCDPALADDMAEHAWARLIVRKPRARRGFISLLRKTAQHLCYKEFKARRAVRLVDVCAGADDPGGVAESNDIAAALDESLGQLAPGDRAFFMCVHAYGMTRRAACELLGWDIAPSTAHQRMERIRARLAALLKKKGIS